MGSFSQGAQGAMGGAMAGGAIGGPLGAGIGGIAGGIMGYLGGSPQDQYQEMLKKLMAGYQGRQGAQAGPASQAGQSQLLGNRAALIAQLEAMARGEGPSAARLQMQQGMDAAVRAQASAAAGAGGRGVNAGAALRNASNQSSAIMSKGNQDMGIMRAQEQLNAVGQLGQNISAGIGQDQSLNQFNAGQMNSTDQFNAQLRQQMMGQNDQAQLQAIQMGMGGAGPGFGTQLMAGGASAVPGILQMKQAGQQQQGSMPGYPQWGNYQGPNPQVQAMQQQLQQMYQQQMQGPNLLQPQGAGSGMFGPQSWNKPNGQ